MARSKWKLNYFSKNLIRKLKNYKFVSKIFKKRYIFSRSSQIPINFMGKLMKIHKGNCFNYIIVNTFNVGYKFGEFSFTKKPYHYPLKKKKK